MTHSDRLGSLLGPFEVGTQDLDRLRVECRLPMSLGVLLPSLSVLVDVQRPAKDEETFVEATSLRCAAHGLPRRVPDVLREPTEEALVLLDLGGGPGC
jgi:hypothetical protein